MNRSKKNYSQTIERTFHWKVRKFKKFNSYSFKKQIVPYTKQIYVDICLLVFSKSLISETYYKKILTYVGQDNLDLQYMDTVSLLLPLNPTKTSIDDIKYFSYDLDFCNPDPPVELCQKDNKKVLRKKNLNHIQI